jgi:hypothetical protein
MLLNEGYEELSEAIICAVRRDLDDMNEVNNCLALQAVCHVSSRALAEELVKDIFKLVATRYPSALFPIHSSAMQLHQPPRQKESHLLSFTIL